ncbi:MAG TPA: glycosyltransferase family 39 protein [Steroidobacteraceae bacterium]|nr:glycosyltransferase family 39 protein [Steroidobacteraceae bacterium]
MPYRANAWRTGTGLLAVALLAWLLFGGILAEERHAWGWSMAAALVPALLTAGLVLAVGGACVASSVPDRGRARLAACIVIYAFALRLAYAGAVDLLPEETYYWSYAQHLDYGYLDHPPMVAWLIRIGVALAGNDELGVRLGAIACAAVGSVFTYRLTRNLFGAESAAASVILAQSLPFFFLAGFLMTPDAPLTAAWAATLYYLERALVARNARAWWGVGFALGFGMISKYSIALLVPAIALFMILDRPARIWWRRPEPYLAAAAALLVFAPVLVWNAEHQWASFAFQTSRRLVEAPRFSLHKLIGSVLVLITPVGVLAVAAVLGSGGRAVGNAGDPRRWLFLRIAVLFPLAVFTLFSLRHEVKLDWTGAPWVAALPVMAAAMTHGGRGLARRLRGAWTPTAAIVLILLGTGLYYLAWGLPGVGYGKHIELVPVAWREFSRQVDEIAGRVRAQSGRDPLIVGMDRYAIASELAFYAAARTRTTLNPSSVHLFGGVGLMYERWTPAEAQDGKTLLLVAWDPRDIDGPSIAGHCERLGPLMEGHLTRDGHAVRDYYYRVAYNYRSARP